CALAEKGRTAAPEPFLRCRAARQAAIWPPAPRRRRRASETGHSWRGPLPPRPPGGTAGRILSRGTSYRRRPRAIPIPLVVGVVLVLVPVVVVLVLLVLLLPVIVILGFLVAGLGPALGLLDPLEVHLAPRFQVDFLDVAVEVLDLQPLGVLVHRQHAEGFFFFDVLVPLAGHRLVISAHRESHPVLIFAAVKCRGCGRVGQRGSDAYSFPSWFRSRRRGESS